MSVDAATVRRIAHLARIAVRAQVTPPRAGTGVPESPHQVRCASVVKGEVTAREPFLIAGQVEGTIDLEGHTLTVAEEGTVSATVSADTVVVQGTIKGETSAATKIAVQPTAKLEGAFSAPSISVAEGAIVHGRIETTRRKDQRAVA